MRRLPSWWAPPLLLLLFLWGAITVYYWTGASGVEVSGSTISFARQHDFALFKLSDRAALLTQKSGFFAVVKYKKGVFPFCPLCGTYEPAGSILNLARYQSGPWIYTDHLGGPFAEIYNVDTGETIDVAEPEPGQPTTLSALPAFRERGLDASEERKISAASIVASGWKPLRAINESCTIFNAAFVFLFGLWIVVGVVSLLRRR